MPRKIRCNPSESSYRLATSKLVQATKILKRVDNFLADISEDTKDIKMQEKAIDIHFQIMNWMAE